MTVLPMFPLGTALLPGAGLPLRVFEPRYRALVRHCVEVGPPEFGVVMIARGFEVGGGDQRTDVGTLARITRLAPFQDGTFALEVVGTRRIRVVEWLPDDPYPRARVEEWADEPPAPGWETPRDEVAGHVRRVFALALECGRANIRELPELLADPVLVSYQLAGLSPFGAADLHRVLCAESVDRRWAILTELLDDAEAVLRFQLGASGS